jgi:murein DD-endopeptidase MepM/ murein hydrolase activator NlpD
MWLALALAQDFRFPTSEEDFEHFYPTAYRDDGGVDWDCQDFFYSGHSGSDFGVGSFAGMDEGQDVVAAAMGMVISMSDGADDRCTSGECDGGDGGSCGNHAKIRYPSGRMSLYCHMKKNSVLVSVGDIVDCGDKIGEVGSSGHSTGPHIHFGAYTTDGSNVDPFEGDCGSSKSYWMEQNSWGEVPEALCDSWAECAPVVWLGCGERWEGRNDGEGSTDRINFEGCYDAVQTGPK